MSDVKLRWVLAVLANHPSAQSLTVETYSNISLCGKHARPLPDDVQDIPKIWETILNEIPEGHSQPFGETLFSGNVTQLLFWFRARWRDLVSECDMVASK